MTVRAMLPPSVLPPPARPTSTLRLLALAPSAAPPAVRVPPAPRLGLRARHG